MFRLDGYAEPIIERLRDTANRIIRALFWVEEPEEPMRTRDEQQPRITEEQKQTHRTLVEVPPRIVPEEKKPTGPRLETETSPSLKSTTRIGKSIFIKGELAVNEDLTVDGRIVGKIEVADHQLVIGPSGIVHAEIQAKDVTVKGKVVGNISAAGMVTIQSTGSLVGGISAARIAINEGAHFKGTVDIILVKAQTAKG
jgi:cytoskeletal protein CcmA (bactofilin family)